MAPISTGVLFSTKSGDTSLIAAIAVPTVFVLVIVSCACCKKRKGRSPAKSIQSLGQPSECPSEIASPQTPIDDAAETSQAKELKSKATSKDETKKDKRAKKRHKKLGETVSPDFVIASLKAPPTPCGKTLPMAECSKAPSVAATPSPSVVPAGGKTRAAVTAPHYFEVAVDGKMQSVKPAMAHLKPVDQRAPNYHTLCNVPVEFKTTQPAQTARIDHRASNYRTLYKIPNDFQPSRMAKTAIAYADAHPELACPTNVRAGPANETKKLKGANVRPVKPVIKAVPRSYIVGGIC